MIAVERTITVELEYRGVKYIKTIRSTPPGALTRFMSEVEIAVRGIRVDINKDKPFLKKFGW